MLRALALFFVAFTLWAAPPEDDIKKVLDDQSAAWNRGDIDGFMAGYANAPDTAFVGKEVTKGWAGVLNRYKKGYKSQAQMGVLTFSGLEVRMLGSDYASVIGHYHLERTKENGGEASGIYTLIFHKTAEGWKIIVDHSS